MEKSSCIVITQHQLDQLKSGDDSSALSLMARWGIATVGELKAIIDSGQYRIVDEN